VFPFHVGMPAASWKATGQYDEVRTCTNTESPFNNAADATILGVLSATLKLGTPSQNTARLSDNGDSSVLRTFSRPSLTRLPRILNRAA
jgi:hypothetical protein